MAWWKWLLAGLAGALVVSVAAGAYLLWTLGKANGDPAFFEDAIAAFEEADRRSPPSKHGIVFVGSSSIRFWSSLAEDMAPLPVLNRGFGGAHFEHVLHNTARIVLPYQPRIVAVYAGDNDLSAGTGKDAARVLREYQDFVGLVHGALPATHVYFLSIKPSRLRWERWPEMSDANARIASFSESDERLHYVDLATPLLDAKGEPREDVFRFDGLHLNSTGYAAWARTLRPILIEAWEQER